MSKPLKLMTNRLTGNMFHERDPSRSAVARNAGGHRRLLNDKQSSDYPFDVSEALDAVRRVFPGLELSDGELLDAITSEASTAGFDIHYDADQNPKALARKALERWDDEGGATGQQPRRE